ncbi:MAG: hypothetical protein AB8F74_19375 [Saprospiraceae bacterium]
MKKRVILTVMFAMVATTIMAQDVSISNFNTILSNLWNGGLKTFLITIVGLAGAIFVTIGAMHFFTDSSNQEKGKKQLLGGLIGLVLATVLFFL